MWQTGSPGSWGNSALALIVYKLLDIILGIIQPSTNERLMAMFSMRYVHGHVMVYDKNGRFLFSADTEREAREELEEYEESAA